MEGDKFFRKKLQFFFKLESVSVLPKSIRSTAAGSVLSTLLGSTTVILRVLRIE